MMKTITFWFKNKNQIIIMMMIIERIFVTTGKISMKKKEEKKENRRKGLKLEIKRIALKLNRICYKFYFEWEEI